MNTNEILAMGRDKKMVGIMKRALEQVRDGLYGSSPKYLKHYIQTVLDEVEGMENS